MWYTTITPTWFQMIFNINYQYRAGRIVQMLYVIHHHSFGYRSFINGCLDTWVARCDKDIKYHDDVMRWKHFPRYWPFVRGIHRSPENFRIFFRQQLAVMLSPSMQSERKTNYIINQSKLNACEPGKNMSYIATNYVNYWELPNRNMIMTES